MSEWGYKSLDEYVGTGQVELGRGKIISKLDIDACPGPYPIYSSSAQGDGKFGEYGKFMFDEELISWSVDGGGNFFYRPKHQFSVTNVSGFLRIKTKEIGYRFLYYSLALQHRDISFDYTSKAHPSVIRKLYSIPSIPKQEQDWIAEILSTLDEAIEQTEALIAKYQQIKAGLMHDLFTGGVTPDGHLRPTRAQAPHLYKDSPLGWIPKEWEVQSLRHFVPIVAYGVSSGLGENPSGIPVLRMNNLTAGRIDITDIKFSDAVEARLLTLKVGDVLFNRTNSLEHVGKTAMWRGELAAASFASYLVRLDVDVQKMRSAYLVYWLNLPSTQIAIRRFATPGVHQVNINPTNLRRMECAAPKDLVEQDIITRRVEQLEKFINNEELQVAKLCQQKHGLMQDLLTGRVRVKVAEAASI